jgi:murein DD-endopeptidase MepM/ murein hydrolase activator NlpD
MRPFLGLVLLVIVITAGALWWLKFERGEPGAAFVVQPQVIGRKTPLDVRVTAGTTPLRSAAVRLRLTEGEKAGTTFDLVAETFEPSADVRERQLHAEPDLVGLGVPEGQAALEVFVETYAWHLWKPATEPRLVVPVSVDVTAPRVEILSAPHNLRLGGADLAVFRQSADTVRGGVAVASYFFPATRGYFGDPEIALALFAAPQDLTGDIRFYVVAADAAGNERRVALPARVHPRNFAARTLPITEDFLARKLPEIFEANRVSPPGSSVEKYLYVNREMRSQNEGRIREVTARSTAVPQWDGPFLRQPNAAPLSSFADRRTYEYNGEVIDHQTHLGFDLASTKLAGVIAAQRGTVVFADNLGIYGNAVIIDHGLGIFSLYGHLSTMAVKQGDTVEAGKPIGQTGETGLAGGDHLHFSLMLYGIHVDPIEWWDAHWLEDHVSSRLGLFPRAAVAAEASS